MIADTRVCQLFLLLADCLTLELAELAQRALLVLEPQAIVKRLRPCQAQYPDHNACRRLQRLEFPQRSTGKFSSTGFHLAI